MGGCGRRHTPERSCARRPRCSRSSSRSFAAGRAEEREDRARNETASCAARHSDARHIWQLSICSSMLGTNRDKKSGAFRDQVLCCVASLASTAKLSSPVENLLLRSPAQSNFPLLISSQICDAIFLEKLVIVLFRHPCLPIRWIVIRFGSYKSVNYYKQEKIIS